MTYKKEEGGRAFKIEVGLNGDDLYQRKQIEAAGFKTDYLLTYSGEEGRWIIMLFNPDDQGTAYYPSGKPIVYMPLSITDPSDKAAVAAVEAAIQRVNVQGYYSGRDYTDKLKY